MLENREFETDNVRFGISGSIRGRGAVKLRGTGPGLRGELASRPHPESRAPIHAGHNHLGLPTLPT